jgi:hypothetical protein
VLAFSNGEICLYEYERKQAKEAGVLDDSVIAAKWRSNEEYYAVSIDSGPITVAI